ncbi:hypothetical protein [Streptomyces bohaiensis]|uniref:Uncharacterized protein n=1 Tax=Streptomyces bohaiensis TaxID=1431344 RepID=A0ABX1C4G4_9ACTN|nr:hypothetical protein [Streptomyces bohaiensis]NJQ14106.1 hypothetical protein [Streptomyces bohaiensis]
MLTVHVTVLLAAVVVARLCRRTQSRSRNDEKVTVVLVLALGVVLAPTPVGQAIFSAVGELAAGVTRAGQ